MRLVSEPYVLQICIQNLMGSLGFGTQRYLQGALSFFGFVLIWGTESFSLVEDGEFPIVESRLWLDFRNCRLGHLDEG